MFSRKLDICFAFSAIGEVVTESVTRSCRICIDKLDKVRNCSCNIFNLNYSFALQAFNVIPVISKVFCVINLLTFLHYIFHEIQPLFVDLFHLWILKQFFLNRDYVLNNPRLCFIFKLIFTNLFKWSIFIPKAVPIYIKLIQDKVLLVKN